MEITLRILCLLVGYLLGSFLTAECIARRLTDRSARDLGSGNPGYSRQSDAKYQAILEAVVNSGMVVAMSAGNSGHWFENTPYTYPYAESVSWATNGSPGSYTNSLGVASVDNVGSTGNYVEFAGTKMFYTDTSEAPIQPMTTLAGEQRFVYVDAVGNPEDFAAAGDELKGAIAMCNRGEINFTAKGNNAVAAGAADMTCDAANARASVVAAFELLSTKRAARLPKKHGNMAL